MDERLREILSGEDAWIVGGAVRDAAAPPAGSRHRRCVRGSARCGASLRATLRGAAFPLSERHGAWRVVAEGIDETVDFTPLTEGIDADLASRDFTFNAIAEDVSTGNPYDPHDGRADLHAGVIRAVSERVFIDDPLRLLRAVRFEDELGFRMDSAPRRSSAPLPLSSRSPRASAFWRSSSVFGERLPSAA